MGDITLNQIFTQLRDRDGDNTELFYLYVSTARREQAAQRQQGQEQQAVQRQQGQEQQAAQRQQGQEQQAAQGQQGQEQQAAQGPQGQEQQGQEQQAAQGQQGPEQQVAQGQENRERQRVMTRMHNNVLPGIMNRRQWRRVVDNDGAVVYRALYFKIIQREINEQIPDFNLRVGRMRQNIAQEMRQRIGVPIDFRINLLLAKPFLYDVVALEDMMGELNLQDQGQ